MLGARSLRHFFVDKLQELSGAQQQLVSNPALRDALAWDENRYGRIKALLVSDGSIIVGRGYSGSVGLAGGPDSQALKIFISYSHTDEKLKDALHKHLKPLERMNLISGWHDRKRVGHGDQPKSGRS